MSRWVKSPKYLLRADAIAYLTRDCAPGRFLEVGAGTGELTRAFMNRGFTGFVYDLGETTRAALAERFSDDTGAVRIVDQVDQLPDRSLDYLFAFEVLEHIVDDEGALAQWCTKLKPGGCVVVSVPAHQRVYGATDARVGHVRRYERAQLEELLQGAGLTVDRIACYGFPLGNIGRMVGNLLDRGVAPGAECVAQQRSITSGTEQSPAVVRLSRIINRWTIAPFLAAQRLTFDTELGDGYVARAVLPQATATP